MEFFAQNGGAKSAKSVGEIIPLALSLLSDKAEIRNMRSALEPLPKENASALIHAHMEELVRGKSADGDNPSPNS